jgi:hypothetical protein
MDIQSTKIELAKFILGIENPGLIQKLMDFLKSESQDWHTELSDSEKEEIEIGLKQLDSGQRISFNDLMKKVS